MKTTRNKIDLLKVKLVELLRASGLSDNVSNTIGDRFANTCKTNGFAPEPVFKGFLENYGSELDIDSTCAVAFAGIIDDKLSEFASNYPAIEHDPIKRMQTRGQRIAALMAKCSLELTGVDDATQQRLKKTLAAVSDKIKFPLKNFGNSQFTQNVAYGSSQGESVELSLEVLY